MHNPLVKELPPALNAIRLILLTLGSWIALIASTLAEDAPATARTASLNAGVRGDAEVQSVRSARSLLGATIKTRAGDEFGTIEDVGLDFGRARVTAVVVTPHDAVDANPEAVAIPITSLQWDSARGDIVLDATSKTPSGTVASDVADEKSRVTRLSAIGDISVTNLDGDKAGRVVDFGIAPQKGVITYAVFTPSLKDKSDDALYPIPLGAFVVREGAKKWILELPEDILENTPTFEKKAWPNAFRWHGANMSTCGMGDRRPTGCKAKCTTKSDAYRPQTNEDK